MLAPLVKSVQGETVSARQVRPIATEPVSIRVVITITVEAAAKLARRTPIAQEGSVTVRAV